MASRLIIFLVIAVIALSMRADINILPTQNTTYASTTYLVNLYTFTPMNRTGEIILNFAGTYITIPNGLINITATVDNMAITSATASCNSSICTIRPNRSLQNGSIAQFIIGNFLNPLFVQRQLVNVTMRFSTDISENVMITIESKNYLPMAIRVNSFTQTNYGVGNTDVVYRFNISAPVYPDEMQLVINLPQQVEVFSPSSTLILFNTKQTTTNMAISGVMSYTFVVNTTNRNSSNGFIDLTVTGFINPKSIGSSSSFRIQMNIPNFPGTVNSCSACTIASISTNLFAQSTVPGNIVGNNFISNNTLIRQENLLTLYTKIFASIPQGGSYQIILPPSIAPIMPIYCMNKFGFTINNNAVPSCSYNATINAIYTNNFAFSGSGFVMMEILIRNPINTAKADFYFQTFDSNKNMIGNSTDPLVFNAEPWVLNAQLSKTNYVLESTYRLNLNITLQIPLLPSHLISIILPKAAYNNPITCSSSGVSVNCSSATDSNTSRLIISMNPPCNPCSRNDKISLNIDGLVNPSFINTQTQSIIITTNDETGKLQQASLSLNLIPSNLVINSYSRIGSNTIGSNYYLTLTYQIPSYIKSNGGKLVLKFSQFDTYINPIYNKQLGVTEYPEKILVEDLQNNQYVHTIEYYDSIPMSLKQISITICTNTTNCSNTIDILDLRRSFAPMSGLTQNIQINTLYDDTVCTASYQNASYSVTRADRDLNVTLSNSITMMDSNYIISFQNPFIPITKTIILTLSNTHNIKGECYVLHNSTLLSSWDCSVMNSTSVKINYDGDSSLMMLQNILISITISNVTNPKIIVPISYSLQTQFNSVVNQKFSILYQITSAYPLILSASKNNNTLGQNAIVNITIANLVPEFNEIKLEMPANLLTVTTSPSYAFNVINNTYFVHQITVLSTKSILLNVVNPPSTSIKGRIIFNMYLSGYLTASGSVELNNTVPMLLGLQSTSSRRIVGESTNITIKFIRYYPYLEQTRFMLNLSSDLFDYSSATIDGKPIVLPFSQPITSTTVTINNLINLKYIPKTPSATSISGWTVDADGNKMAQSVSDVVNLLPNLPARSSSFNFTRNNTQINGVGRITINYLPVFSSIINYMVITMPLNQAKIASSNCSITTPNNSSPSCTMLSMNQTSITISFLNQTTTTLFNIINLQPNNNPLTVSLYTINNELVESVSANISPPIQYNQLKIGGTTNSSETAAINLLSFTIQTVNSIQINNKIVINFPKLYFVRLVQINNRNCAYIINGVVLNGCSYEITDGVWVKQINITNLGATAIPANSVISLQLTLINPLFSIDFANSLIEFYVASSTDSFVAFGMISLTKLFNGLTSINTGSIKNIITNQTSSMTNTSNAFTFRFSLPFPIINGSVILLSIPKSTYTLNNQSNMTNLPLVTQQQSQNYYILSLSPFASLFNNAVKFLPSSNTYEITISLFNNRYMPLMSNPLSVQLKYNQYSITSRLDLSVFPYSPQPLLNANITRTNRNAYEDTLISINLANPMIENFFIIISPLTNSSLLIPIANNIESVASDNSPLSFQKNSTEHIKIQLNAKNATMISVIIKGKNSLLISQNLERYQLTIMDNNFIYLSGLITPIEALIPYKTGLSLQRIITTVDQPTNLFIHGNFPINIPNMIITFRGNNYPIIDKTFNISLGSITNNHSISDSSLYAIRVQNNEFLAYSNQLSILPALTPQELTSFLSFNIANNVPINSNTTLTLKFNNTQASSISIEIFSFFSKINMCCIDPQCNQDKILSCNYITTNGRSLIQMKLKSNQNVSNLNIMVTTLDYQVSFDKEPVNIITALPTSQVTVISSMMVSAMELNSTLTVQHLKVNAVNSYNFLIRNINRAGYLRIVIPSFINAQVKEDSSKLSLSTNGTAIQNINIVNSVIVLPISPFNYNISLVATSINNPISNEPFEIVAEQAEDIAFSKIFGCTSKDIVMEEFDAITIESAVRSVTEVGVNTNLTMIVNGPNYSDHFVISFPASQIYASSSCTILLNSNISLACKVINSSAILTISTPGKNTYLIGGLFNFNAFDKKNAKELVVATIGTPYTQAVTNIQSSTYITPELSLGKIILNQFKSTNNQSLTATSLLYDINIQNANSMNGILISYNSHYFILPHNLKCNINTLEVKCIKKDNYTIFLPFINSKSESRLVIQVDNIINYVRPSNWSIKSVNQQNGSFSDVDNYFSEGIMSGVFSPSDLPFRIINPYKYAQRQPVTFSVIIDLTNYAHLPIKEFLIHAKSDNNVCTELSSPFDITLRYTCTFSQSKVYPTTVKLYHQGFKDNVLSTGTKGMFIYPETTNNCNNQMCDSCSMVNGDEYCFRCRQGLLSSDGKCQPACNYGSFNYANTKICQECHPTCSNCFGLYDSNCLNCKNTSLLVNSGKCMDKCPEHLFQHKSYCVNSKECNSANGCRLCSDTGFCYQCLPDFTDEPTCKYNRVMPVTIMFYILIPVILLALASIMYPAVKCVGFSSFLSQTIFSFSLLELFAWFFTLPIINDISVSMGLVTFITLRIIISIVAYELYYKKNLGELSQKLLQEESQKETEKEENKKESESNVYDNWKTKLVRFIAHFNGPDSYELFQSKASEPYIAIKHSVPIQIIFMINRWIVFIIMCYLMSISTVGDSVLMPITNIVLALVLSLCRLITWDKFRACLQRLRK